MMTQKTNTVSSPITNEVKKVVKAPTLKTFEGQDEMAIIGSGPAAIAEAIRLSLDASKVTILSDKKSLQADSDLVQMLDNYHNISVLHNVEVVDTMEIENGRAMYMQYKNKDTGIMFLLPVQDAYNTDWVPPEKQANITPDWVKAHVLSGVSSKGHPTPISVTNEVKNHRLSDIKIRAVRRDNSK